MHNKLLTWPLVFLLLLMACERDSLTQRQVKAIPDKIEDNHLLNIDKHISLTPRPKETFPFPIEVGKVGPIQSLYSGKHQYPFYCMTLDAELGQPLVDNDKGIGVPVYDDDNKLIGYSKDCLFKTRVDYYYVRASDNQIIDYDPKQPPAKDSIASVSVKGKKVPEIYRLERGSINRYIYYILMLTEASNAGDRLSANLWNKKVIYQFKGGASIGFRQGGEKPKRLIKARRDVASQGYAVLASSGNKTAYGYNLLLAEDTARRVKKQFTSLYGEPLYTLGIGGSGGALAQYIIAQNSEGILDGIMPLYSYPDMVSQSIYLLDCDLLQNYFNLRDHRNARWKDWEQRQLIEGLNGINGYEYPFAFIQPINQLIAGSKPFMPNGSSECVRSWFIASTFFYNPNQGFIKPYFAKDVQKKNNWTHWDDLIQIYGKDDKGFARTTWGNEGVQYGLKPLREGKLTIGEFLKLNQSIGSWKEQDEMKPERSIRIPGVKYPLWLSLWSRHNITQSSRKTADAKAIERGYRYGQIFVGKAELPILELRHYLEEKLDMHHTSASIEARMRIENFQGHSKNHVLWITRKKHTPIQEGIALLDKWIMARKTRSDNDLLKSKPKELMDTCFNAKGEVLATGETVWDGPWNNKKDGDCLQHYPIYSNSRIQAGGPWAGSIFKCNLIPVATAIDNGTYGKVAMHEYQEILTSIFPTGVCDYGQGDSAKPNLALIPKLKAGLAGKKESNISHDE
jgi:hypothetical protein